MPSELDDELSALLIQPTAQQMQLDIVQSWPAGTEIWFTEREWTSTDVDGEEYGEPEVRLHMVKLHQTFGNEANWGDADGSSMYRQIGQAYWSDLNVSWYMDPSDYSEYTDKCVQLPSNIIANLEAYDA